MAKITSINYSKLYALGAFMNERIGVEATIDEGEDPKAVLQELKKLTNEFHFENNKELYEMKGTKVTDIVEGEPVIKVDPKTSQVQSIIKDISTVTDLVVLDSYKMIAKNNPEIQTAYDNQLKVLSNGLQQH